MSFQIDNSVLQAGAVVTLGGIAVGSLILGQIDLCKSVVLIFGGFISAKALDSVSNSSA